MGINHLFSIGHLDLSHHQLVHLHQEKRIIAGIRVPKILELGVLSLKVVWHKRITKLPLTLDVEETTQENVVMTQMVALSVIKWVIS